MVDQVSMDAPVTVFERMYIDKAECNQRGSNYRIEAGRICICKIEQPRHERLQVFSPSADMFGQGRATVAITFSDKSSLDAVAHPHEAGVWNDDPLQAAEFFVA